MEKTQKKGLLFEINREFSSDTNFMPEGKYPTHCHDYFELELVLSGEGYQFFNDERFDLKKGSMYLLRPLDYHQINSKNLTITNNQVKENALSTFTMQKIYGLKNPVVFTLKGEDFDQMKSLMALFAKEASDTSKHDGIIQELGELIFSYYLRYYEAACPSENASFVNKISYYLHHDNKFTQKVTLDEIAEYAGYSKFYTSNMFHKLYGTTLQDYIIDLRINYAKKMILESNDSIGDIVTMSGFSTSSTFFAQFTKKVGLSPLQYRKKYKTSK